MSAVEVIPHKFIVLMPAEVQVFPYLPAFNLMRCRKRSVPQYPQKWNDQYVVLPH